MWTAILLDPFKLLWVSHRVISSDLVCFFNFVSNLADGISFHFGIYAKAATIRFRKYDGCNKVKLDWHLSSKMSSNQVLTEVRFTLSNLTPPQGNGCLLVFLDDYFCRPLAWLILKYCRATHLFFLLFEIFPFQWHEAIWLKRKDGNITKNEQM